MLELFETPLTVLHVFVCFFLILVVLIQPGKSGGLGAALGGAGATQVFGGRGAGNFLSRATWICASTFFLTSIVLAYISSSADDSLEGLTSQTSGETTKEGTAPADQAPANAPADQENAEPETPVAPVPEEQGEPAAEEQPEPGIAAAPGDRAELVAPTSPAPIRPAVTVVPGPNVPPAVRITPPIAPGAIKPPIAALPAAPKTPVVPAPVAPVTPTPVAPGAAKQVTPVAPAAAKPVAPVAPGAPLKPTATSPAAPAKPVAPAPAP